MSERCEFCGIACARIAELEVFESICRDIVESSLGSMSQIGAEYETIYAKNGTLDRLEDLFSGDEEE